jgi:hypothetical protein
LILVANEIAEQPLDVPRILSQQPLFEPFVNQRPDRLLLPFQRRFADPRQTCVRREPQEQVIPQSAVGEEGFQLDDLHGATLVVGTLRVPTCPLTE